MDRRGWGTGYGSWGREAQGVPSRGSCANPVIANASQHLGMLSQLEGDSWGDRCGPFDSFDSHSSFLTPHDEYRSNSYGTFGPGQGGLNFLGGGGGNCETTFACRPAKLQQMVNYSSGPNWNKCMFSPVGGHGFHHSLQLHPPWRGNRGDSSPGILPSLMSQCMHSEAGPGPPDFLGRGWLEGGSRTKRQRGRKKALNRYLKSQQDKKKKRTQNSTNAFEPQSKRGRTKMGAEELCKGLAEVSGGEQARTIAIKDEGTPDDEDACPSSSDVLHTEASRQALIMQQEVDHKKQNMEVKPISAPGGLCKLKKRKGFLERVTFNCSICKFRSCCSNEMAAHMKSNFHKEHFKCLSNQLSEPTANFLQEYLDNKHKKTELWIKRLENCSDAVYQFNKEQDPTKEVDMEHFVRKVEAAHCGACGLLIPMQHHVIQRHLRCPNHHQNQKGMMERSKWSGLSVARSILNQQAISEKLKSYLKGANPFAEGTEEPVSRSAMTLEETQIRCASRSQEESKGGCCEAGQVNKRSASWAQREGHEEKEEGEFEDDDDLEGELGEEEQSGEEHIGDEEVEMEDDEDGILATDEEEEVE